LDFEEVEWRNYEAICLGCRCAVRYLRDVRLCEECSVPICPSCESKYEGLHVCHACFQKLLRKYGLLSQAERIYELYHWRSKVKKALEEKEK